MEDRDLIRALAERLREIKPDYLVITGDIVNKCTTANFHRAATTIRELVREAEMDIGTQVLIIPGNHDIKIRKYKHRHFGRPFHFAKFLKEVFDEPDTTRRKPRFIKIDPQRQLCFFALDSTLKRAWQMAEGEIGQDQREWLDEAFDNLERTHIGFCTYVKVVLMHHHPHPIPNTSLGERFMQLLDGADLEKIIAKHRIHLVLHGHKHHPYERQMQSEDDQHYLVIGSGTTLCPIADEQFGGSGNSFNVLRVDRGANIIDVQRYRADSHKTFVALGEPKRFQLSHAAASGYKMSKFVTITSIKNEDGDCYITCQRLGIMVNAEREALEAIKFVWASESALSSIVGFDYGHEGVKELRHEKLERHERQGYFDLTKPLTWGVGSIDLWWTFDVERTMCMRRHEFPSFYPTRSEPHEESVSAHVIHPTDELVVVVEFPHKYRVSPEVRCLSSAGEQVPLGARAVVQVDQLSGRCTLTVIGPELNHEYGLWWTVPV